MSRNLNSNLTHILPRETLDASGLEVTISGWGGTRQYHPGNQVRQPRQCTLKEGVVKVREESCGWYAAAGACR